MHDALSKNSKINYTSINHIHHRESTAKTDVYQCLWCVHTNNKTEMENIETGYEHFQYSLTIIYFHYLYCFGNY
jgi:hypothetical protein